MTDHLLGANNEIGKKIEEIVELRTGNERLKSDLKVEKYLMERMSRS